MQLKNSSILKATIIALYEVSGRRTTERIANEAIGSTIKTLEGKYDFLKHVRINENEISEENFGIDISEKIDNLDKSYIGNAIESLIRVVYTDLNTDAGLYFITEFREYIGEDVANQIVNYCGIDLDQIQLEQHHLYWRQERKKTAKSPDQTSSKNLLGYTWDNVSAWKHEPDSQFCVLYDSKGNILDKLNLDRIIENYVQKLSGSQKKSEKDLEREVMVYERDYKLLELMYSRDMDIKTAAHLLGASKEEINSMIQKLSEFEMLQYTSNNTVELTDVGISYLSKKQKKLK